MKWQKYQQYLNERLANLQGTPYSIAAGVACGAAISFTPFVGAHLVLAMMTAWLIRANVVAAALGTAVGNPWTFPFIWPAVFYVGRKLLGMEGNTEKIIDFSDVFSKAYKALVNLDFSLFFNDIWPILKHMMVGCVPFYVIVWVGCYYILKPFLRQRNRNEGNLNLR